MPHTGKGRELEDAELLMLVASPNAGQMSNAVDAELKHWRQEAEQWRAKATLHDDADAKVDTKTRGLLSKRGQASPKDDTVDAASQRQDRA